MVNFKQMLASPVVSPHGTAFYQDRRDCYEGQFVRGLVNQDRSLELTLQSEAMGQIHIKGFDNILELENVLRQLIHSARRQWPDDPKWRVMR